MMQRSQFETQVSNRRTSFHAGRAPREARPETTTTETEDMRLASWSWGGRDHVGTISADGREATPLTVADASRGALPLIEALTRGEPLPGAAGPRVAVEAISLRAPLPRPLRSILCVGRNYRTHAAELA